tara:strand:- start:2115 stop:2654 length:540 start_codon:yes stop_codon:yes gene_type:complete
MSQIKVDSIIPRGGLGTGAVGGIIQVVSTFKSDTFSTTVNSMNLINITGLSANITPQSTSSKILIVVNIGGCSTPDTGQRYGFGLKRGGTVIGVATGASNRTPAMFATTNFEGNSNAMEGGASFHFLDSPSSTSQLSYSVWTTIEGNGNEVFINKSSNDSDSSSVFRASSNITCFEMGS